MKKLYFIIIAILLVSCSNNESNEIADEGTSLKNYKLLYQGDQGFIHYFNDSQAIESVRTGPGFNDFVFYNFEYQNNLMSKFEYLNGLGDILQSYNFNYDSNGKLTSLVYKKDSFEYTRNFTYSNNSISSIIPDENSNDTYKITFLLNEKGLVKELTKINLNNNEIEALVKFTYDNNDNCTFIFANIDYGFGAVEKNINLQYSDKNNPLKNHYATSYIPYFAVYGDFKFLQEDIISLIVNFGNNTVIKSPELNFEYIYNSNGYPISGEAFDTSTGNKSHSLEYSY
ncbi:hypothetical protein SAMN04489761_4196 [Tenacibaculum sp. MAR_2009_124]|uniref:DUF4595 domain-containing protein n=1 Tax=Tenacibaculum sp. MAR_2009_124 TaxID=1250059 RepID=UPI00089750D0|nr:DUF4595 domain-containing protein [Tenacibaculum sp. MAR_2009_124]SED07687.1 hypothetical protein SAMN04489761_4196 [Tenacibaculum sp. MAR_2009_124]